MISPSPRQPQSADAVEPLDVLDAKLIRCLQIAPRARFGTIGDALGVSAPTVARRYRRLHTRGAVHIRGVAAIDRTRPNSWLVRVRCDIDDGERLAEILAGRDRVRWVVLCSGGAEVVYGVQTDDLPTDAPALAWRDIRRAAAPGANFELSRALILRRFPVPEPTQWAGLCGTLSPAQERALIEIAAAPDRPTVGFDDADLALVAALAEDGRAPIATLAKDAGLSEGRATRRLAALLESGAVQFRVDLDPTALGFAAPALLWLRVSPSHLDAVGHTVAADPRVMYASAVSGAHNLVVRLTCRDIAELYDFVTGTIGRFDGVGAVEISPVLRRAAPLAS